jgi:hypothetical protein
MLLLISFSLYPPLSPSSSSSPLSHSLFPGASREREERKNDPNVEYVCVEDYKYVLQLYYLYIIQLLKVIASLGNYCYSSPLLLFLHYFNLIIAINSLPK